MMKDVSYFEGTLKRLPLIIMCFTIGWYVISKLNTIENKIEKLELLSFKDKEVIDAKLNEVQKLTQINSNRTTELEKDLIRLLAIMPNRTEVPKIEENEN